MVLDISYNMLIILRINLFKEWVQCNLSKGKKNSVSTTIIEGILLLVSYKIFL